MAERPGPGFAGLLRQLRAESAMTQEELAEAAGLSPRSVSDLERGINRTARKDTAEQLAAALGLAEPVRALFVAAARGRFPAADVLAAAGGEAGETASEDPVPGWSGCPYLGLLPFQERDARVFYGRGELAAQLVRRLDGAGILLLAGESGAGKSSLLRAGLMPRLAAGALGPGSQRWPRRVIRPTGSPLRELAMHLAGISGADPVSVYRSLSSAPGEAPMLVEHAVRNATAGGAGASPRLVLVIDQFEELFTAGGDADVGQAEREAFIAALHAAATVPAGPRKLPPALVVAAVRADCLGRLIAYPPLKAALDAGPFTVGPMSEAELRLAITGPAAEAGLSVELALVEAVIAELREGAGNALGSGVLPLISQAMAATWEHREGSELTLRAYRRAGGAADAVNRSAQAAYDALTSRQKDAARLVFTQLTVITPEGRFARHRCSRTDLHFPGPQPAADIDAVIDGFSARRLLVLGEDSVEISHDVLLHAWQQFRDWLGDDQLDRALYSQVVTDARTWDINRRDSSYLYRPGRLSTIDAAATRWQDAPTRYPPLTATSEAFLRAAHHAASRSTRWRRGVIAGLAALTLIALSAAGIAAHDAASVSRQQAIALSRQLAAESLIIASGYPLTARRLAVAAWQVFPTDQALSVMTTLLTQQQQDGVLPGDPADGGVKAVAFSPSGNLLASAEGDGTVRLWDPATGQAVGAPLPAGIGGGVNGVAFSPSGRLLASADGDGTVRLWDPVTGHAVGAPLRTGNAQGLGVNAVAFSPSGKLLASAGADGTVQLWDLATRQVLGILVGSGSGVNAVAFSPSGKLLASADADGTVRLWDPATGQAVGAPLPADIGGSVNAVAFSPSGKLLASADADGTVRLWDPATGHPVGTPFQTGTGPGSGVNAVAFSPDGQLLAGADADGLVRLWDPFTSQAPRAPLPASAGIFYGVNGVAFSPSGRLLASADGDGTVRLWDPVTGQPAGAPVPAEPSPLSRARGAFMPGVNGVAFSPSGKLLASADADGTVRLWDPATGHAAGAPLTAAAGVNAVAFSPDGRLLAVGDGTVQIWNAVTRRLVASVRSGSVFGARGLAFSPSGRLLATADGDGTVRLWDPVTGQPAGAPLPADTGPGGGVNGVAFSPSGKLLASADADGTVRLWDPVTGQAVGAPLRADTGDGVSGVAFSPDGKLLASADGDGTVRLWDPVTGQPVGAPLPAETGPLSGVRGVAFSPDGQLLASADGDSTVRTWQIALFADPYAALCADVGSPTKADWAQYAPGERQPGACR